jgi:hypothetical protein
MNIFNISINGVDVTRYAVYPFNFQFTLDDALDQAYIELRNTQKTDAYDAFSLVSVSINDSEPTLYYISVDNCVINQKTGLADHKLLLIEETKILERVICRAKSFVKPLVSDYLAQKVQANGFEFNTVEIFNDDESFYANKMYPELSNNEDNPTYQFTNNPSAFVYAKSLLTPSQTGTKLSVTDVFGINISESITNYYWMLEIHENGVRVGWANQYRGASLSSATLELSNPGAYTLYAWMWIQTATTTHNCAAEYFIASADPTIQPPNLTITTVTNQLLEIAEPIKRGEAPRFTLNSADATKYANTPCAELNFANGASLWENLLEIGKIIHCIPRLKNNVVYFDKLGSNDVLEENAFGTPISQTSDKTSEKFASHLDSVVNGLMNLDDEGQGAISDPFERGFRTVRSEISNTDMRTTVDSCIVRTVEPIEKITKVTVWISGVEYDITPYIYEKKEYDLLYSNQGSYPYAKAYALYYVQGQPNIYGLTYKEKDPVSPIFENYAIENILKVVTGADIHLGGDVIKDGVTYAPLGLINLPFNVKYITSINGRVRQVKRNVDDIKTVAVMAFNQAANRLSSVNYGKRLKGEIAMMGSADVKLAFKTNNWIGIKSAVGKIYPEKIGGSTMYISSVTAKMWGGYFITELGLTKNFNQLGRFVSINSAVRQFEIDTNVSESFFLSEEYLVFSEVFAEDYAQADVRGDILRGYVLGVLSGNVAANGSKVTLVQSRTSDENNSTLRAVYLPVQSLALGNSLLFNFKYEDNYSAGETLKTLAGKDYKLTQFVPYGDPLYGEAKHLGYVFMYGVYPRAESVIKVGDELPILSDFSYDIRPGSKPIFASSFGFPYIVNKSSRDALNVTYQIHFVTDCGLIFGEQLMQGNPLVGGTISDVPKNGANPIIYLYSGRVNEMTGESDTPHIGTALLNYASYNTYAQLVASGATTDDYNSWNIKDVNGRVLLAKNGKFNTITYYTRRKIGG